MVDQISRPLVHEVHVWHADLRVIDGRRAALTGLLSEEELERAARLRFDDDRRRFVFARGVLRILLGGYLDTEPASLVLDTSDKGKPRLSDEPGLSFNLSHAGDALLLGVAGGAAVGVDIECESRAVDVERLASAVLHPAEQQLFSHLEGEEKARQFLRYWTHKEAYLKALGVGLGGGLSSVEIEFRDGGGEARVLDHVSERGNSGWRVTTWDCLSGYVAAIAVEDKQAAFSRREIEDLF